MPKFDKTGPQGKGPKTGRGFGPCAGFAPHGFGMGTGRMLGRGQGRGMGFGFQCCPFYACCGPKDAKEQKELLTEHKKMLEEKLKMIEKEIASLGKDK